MKLIICKDCKSIYKLEKVIGATYSSIEILKKSTRYDDCLNFCVDGPCDSEGLRDYRKLPNHKLIGLFYS